VEKDSFGSDVDFGNTLVDRESQQHAAGFHPFHGAQLSTSVSFEHTSTDNFVPGLDISTMNFNNLLDPFSPLLDFESQGSSGLLEMQHPVPDISTGDWLTASALVCKDSGDLGTDGNSHLYWAPEDIA
jgi:hypothetical protein